MIRFRFCCPAILLVLLLWFSTAAVAALPTYQGIGTAKSGTGSVTPTWPTHQSGDIALLFVESAGGQTVTLSTAAGFSQVENSPQTTSASGTNGTRITVFWARATSSGMANPTVADAGDHVNAQILSYRGVIDSGNPWDATAGGSKATASTSVSVTGVSTSVPNTLIVQVASKDLDTTSAGFASKVNANLTNIVERTDIGTSSGNGGGFAVWDGGKAAAGATGNTTATVTNSVNAYMTIALKPAAPISTANSTVVASPTKVAADNSATSLITVTLKDGANNGVSGKKVSLAKSGGNSVITILSGTTNANGQASFSVKDGTVEGPITYTATDVTDNIMVTQMAQVMFAACLSVPTTVDVNGTAVAAPVIAGTSNLEVGNNSYITADGAPLYTQGNGTSMTTTYGVGPPGQTLPPFSPATFPSVGGANASVNNSNLGAGSYGTVSVDGSSTFSGGSYYISQLTAGNGVTLTLAAGDYFVDNWNVGNNFVLNLSSGPVRIFINNTFQAGNESGFNVSGSTANLQIYAYNGAEIQFGNANNGDSNIDFNGLIYAPGSNTKIEFGNNNIIQGSILSGGTVNLGNNTGVIFDAVTQAAIASISLNGGSCGVSFSVAKSFAPNPTTVNGSSTLSITLTNPSATAVTGVAFTDNYPSADLKNAATPALANSCGGTAIGNAAASFLSLSGGTIPASGSCTVTVNVTSGVAASYLNRTRPVTAGNSGANPGASATLLVSAVAVGAFNAFETSTAANATSGRIYTKLAGTGFSLDLVAISGGGQDVSFNNNVKIELLANTGTPGSGYGSDNCPSASTLIQTINSAAISGGRSAVSFPAVAGAYRDVRVRISYPTSSPTVTICSTDSFAIRPSAVTLLTSANAVAPSASATPTFKTGANFSLSASTSAGNGYAGTLTLDPSKLTAQNPSSLTAQNGGVVGTLTPSSLTANAAAVNATYSEVGYLYLAPAAYRDSSFTAVDQVGDCVANSTSVSLVGGQYGCTIGNDAPVSLGRFIPDHFDVNVNLNGAMAAACLAGGFSYTGQVMGYGSVPALTIMAMNAATSGSVTQNYWGLFQKLLAAGVSIASPTTDATQLGQDGLNKTALSASMTTGVLVNNNSGTMTYTLSASDQFTYTRNANALIVPYTTTLALIVTSVAEGEVSAVGSLLPLPQTVSPSGVSMRYGRARMQNAYGSELLDLPVLFRTEYLASTVPSNAWITNAADSCTNSNLVFTPVGTPDITSNTCVLEPGNNSGQGCAVALTPTQTNRRYLETGVIGTDSNGIAGFAGNFNLWLRAPSVNHRGSIDITATVDSWLQYLWPKPANPANLMPWARATFGIYRSPLIYRRENY